MPLILLLALGASVYFIASGVAGAAKKETCSDEAMRNLVLTGIAIFKQKVDGKIRVSAEAAAQARIVAKKCKKQLAAFLKANPATANELRKAKDAFDAKRGFQRVTDPVELARLKTLLR